MKTLLSRSLYY